MTYVERQIFNEEDDDGSEIYVYTSGKEVDRKLKPAACHHLVAELAVSIPLTPIHSGVTLTANNFTSEAF